MKNLILGLCVLFFFLLNTTVVLGQFTHDEERLCKNEPMPTNRHVIISNSRDSYRNCPLNAVNDYRTKLVKPIGKVFRITVCNVSPVPEGYKVESWSREGQCVSLGINDQTVKVLVVEDRDGDGYNYNNDCDDNNANINPRARENPNNGIDDNCNGMIDEVDSDGDGYYIFKECSRNCKPDCDDNNEYAGIKESREIPNNNKDDDCNGLVDEEDVDGDGVWIYKYCVRKNCPPQDCDDNNRYARIQRSNEIPGNGLDDDCDRLVDEVDSDGDGFLVYELCLPGRSCPEIDCDDKDEFVYPRAPERPFNDKDDDCDGMVDERDIDRDGVITYDSCTRNCPEEKDCDDNNANIYPGARDIVNNGIDENCSGKDNIVIWQMSSGGTDTWERLNRRSPLTRKMEDLLVGDFDGDGISDIFRANGNNWVMFSGGKEEMEILEAAVTIKAQNLKLGDFDGDGITDVLNATGSIWRYASGGKKPWIILKENTAELEKLYIGDFDGDNIDDIAVISAQKVKYASKGTGDFQFVEGRTYQEFGFLIGDFNGDGQADIFNGNGNNWRILYSASDRWRILRAQETTTNELNVGHFNLVDGAGNVDKEADVFKATGEDWRTWYGGLGGRKILKTATETEVLFGDFNGDGTTDVFRIRTLGE